MFSGTSLNLIRLVLLYFRSNNYENGYILANSDCYSIVFIHFAQSHNYWPNNSRVVVEKLINAIKK